MVGGNSACGVLPPHPHFPEPEEDLSDEERENLETVRDFIEKVWNGPWPGGQGNPEGLPDVPPDIGTAIDDLVNSAYIRHVNGRIACGRTSFVEAVRKVHAYSPNLHLHIEGLVAEGDRVMARLTVTGTDVGVGGLGVNGLRATGEQFTATSTVLYRLVDGKIAEDWLLFDILAPQQGP